MGIRTSTTSPALLRSAASNKLRQSCSLFIIPALLALVASRSPADSLTALEETAEAMIQAQGVTSMVLGLLPANLEPTTLNFISTTNASDRSFSYSLAPGSLFQGSSITMSTTGAFNSTSSQWDISSAMSWAGVTWSETGTLSVLGDPRMLCEFAFDLNIPGIGRVRAACDAVIEKELANGILTSSGNFRAQFGSTTFSVDALDRYVHNLEGDGWHFFKDEGHASLLPFRDESFGVLAPGTGTGTFVTHLQPVPEPFTAIPLLAMLASLWIAKKRRYLGAPRNSADAECRRNRE